MKTIISSQRSSLSFDYENQRKLMKEERFAGKQNSAGEMGHRIAKHSYDKDQAYNNGLGQLVKSTYYVLDAQGNTMATYERSIDNGQTSLTFAQTEKFIYGSSRLGVQNCNIGLLGSQNNTYTQTTVAHRIGKKGYELSNHLGNVLSVISDKVIPHSNASTIDNWQADILQSTDYSPFGVTLKGRNLKKTGLADEFRYGFQNQEMDDEVKGDGNSYDFGARMQDPRLGRFLSLDNYTSKFPSQSPYSFACNTPIMGIDVNGDSLYILTYVSGNKRGDDMFKAAALTRQYDIEHSKGFDAKRDKVVLIEITDLGKLESKVEKAVKDYSKTYGPTVEFGIWSHSALQGPIGADGDAGKTSGPDAIEPNQMKPSGWGKIDFNWSKGSGNRALFYGCRGGMAKEDGSMSFTRELSTLKNFKDVTLGGQSDYSFPSEYTDYRSPTFAQTFGEFLPIEYTPMAKEASMVLRKTYMVASDKKLYSTERASLIGAPAKGMNFSKNGKFTGTEYQKGDKK